MATGRMLATTVVPEGLSMVLPQSLRVSLSPVSCRAFGMIEMLTWTPTLRVTSASRYRRASRTF